MSTEALFEPAGTDTWTATGWSRGPWHADFCHGGPVAALLARSVEALDTDDAWQVAQLRVELTRPVPVGRPLRVHTEIARPGRKVSAAASTLVDGDDVVARSRAMRIRRAAIEYPSSFAAPPAATLPGPSGLEEVHLGWPGPEGVAFHSHSCDFRVARGAIDAPGPVAVWVRLRTVLVPGETPSGLQRVVAAADFGNGMSKWFDPSVMSFINPDLSVNLARPARGEWIALDAETHLGDAQQPSGAAFAESALYDADGRIGRATQSLLIEPTAS